MALRKSEKTGHYVEINKNALRTFVNSVGGPVAAEVLSLATEIANEVRSEAPVAEKRTHGRAPGYLKARIYLRPGSNVALGPYVDVVSPAKSPEGFSYAAYYRFKKRDYFDAPAGRVYERRAATPKIIE